MARITKFDTLKAFKVCVYDSLQNPLLLKAQIKSAVKAAMTKDCKAFIGKLYRIPRLNHFNYNYKVPPSQFRFLWYTHHGMVQITQIYIKSDLIELPRLSISITQIVLTAKRSVIELVSSSLKYVTMCTHIFPGLD